LKASLLILLADPLIFVVYSTTGINSLFSLKIEDQDTRSYSSFLTADSETKEVVTLEQGVLASKGFIITVQSSKLINISIHVHLMMEGVSFFLTLL